MFFNWKPRLRQDKSETCCFEELCVWLGRVFPSLQSLPFSELGRFGINNQTHPKSTIFLLYSHMQFGYINGITYYLIAIFVDMVSFKCSVLQEQNQRLYDGK